MCWIENIERLNLQRTDKDIEVYKIVKKATRKYCVFPFMDYTYYLKNIQPSLTLGVMIEPNSCCAEIKEGYSSVNFVCDSVMLSIDRMLYKSIQCGNRIEMFRVNNSLYLPKEGDEHD